MTSFVWALNLDADDELSALGRGARFDSKLHSAALRGRTRAARAALAPLVGAALVLDHDAPPFAAAGRIGRAFCPTPSARSALAAAGARVAEAPPVEVLVRANHRKFSADLGLLLPGASYVASEGDLTKAFDGEVRARGGEWVLKHPHGYVGRNRHRAVAVDDAARRFAFRALEEAGGLVVEPWVARMGDYAIHGFVARDGAIALGDPTRQDCDAQGVWRGTSLADDLSVAETDALFAEADRTARALVAAGYFGPFGVDAFRYVAEGRAAFRARCEINARYTMGWAVGMGARRPDLVLP